MKNRVRYIRQNIIANSFYQLPKFLFDIEFEELSNDARVLYALLRNRHELSIKNEWYDENDEVFIYFKREDMQNMLHLSEKTITKAMKDLKSYNLLEEVRQGAMKPNKIYLLSAMVEQFGIGTAEPLENAMNRKIHGSRPVNFAVQDSQNLRLNYNNKNHNNIVMSSQSKLDGHDETDGLRKIEAYTELIKENIGYNNFIISRPYDMKLIDELIAIIVDVILSDGKTIRINSEDKPRALISSALMKLRYENIEFVVAQFKTVAETITKKKQYIISMLYNSSMECDVHYTNMFYSGGGVEK